MKLPPYLKPGNAIAIVCPAGYLPAERAAACIRTVKKWGYTVVKGKTLGGKSKNYFSGTDQERLADLQQYLDDPSISAILCGRGGYGTTRILDDIDWSRFKKNPKWLIGFSDLTVLHGFMHEQLKIASIHGPMAAAFNEDNEENRFTLSLKDNLEGKPVFYQTQHHAYNQAGKAKAPVVGGNLCLLAHCIGSNAAYKTDGKILFIEDVGEQRYNIDRMLLQLKRAGVLKKLKGLIIGKFSDNKDTDRPFGKSAYQIIHDLVKEYNYPICFEFPIGHEKENLAITIGKTYTLVVDQEEVSLSGM